MHERALAGPPCVRSTVPSRRRTTRVLTAAARCKVHVQSCSPSGLKLNHLFSFDWFDTEEGCIHPRRSHEDLMLSAFVVFDRRRITSDRYSSAGTMRETRHHSWFALTHTGEPWGISVDRCTSCAYRTRINSLGLVECFGRLPIVVGWLR